MASKSWKHEKRASGLRHDGQHLLTLRNPPHGSMRVPLMQVALLEMVSTQSTETAKQSNTITHRGYTAERTTRKNVKIVGTAEPRNRRLTPDLHLKQQLRTRTAHALPFCKYRQLLVNVIRNLSID